MAGIIDPVSVQGSPWLRSLETWERHSARRQSVERLLAAFRAEPAKRPAHSNSIGDYSFESYRGRYFEEGEDVKRRSVVIAIRCDGSLIGLAHLKEWSVSAFASPVEFYEAADDISAEEGHFALLINSYWSWDGWPPEFGNVVLFSRLGIDTASDKGRQALPSLGNYLHEEFRRRASVLLLKAFPLEFEGALFPRDHELGQEDGDRRRGLHRRTAALLRMYSAALDFQKLTDQEGYSSWMWREMRYCPDPLPVADPGWLEETDSQ